MQEADLVIALGARFDDRVTGSIAKFAPQAKAAAAEKRGGIVHFEIMPKNIVSFDYFSRMYLPTDHVHRTKLFRLPTL